MIKFVVDKEEVPYGHSATIVARNEYGYYAVGTGNNVQQLSMVFCHIELEKYGIEIHGGKKLRNYINEHKGDWVNASLNYLVEHLSENEVTLFEFLEIISGKVYADGVKDGKQQIRTELQKMIGVS